MFPLIKLKPLELAIQRKGNLRQDWVSDIVSNVVMHYGKGHLLGNFSALYFSVLTRFYFNIHIFTH